jgi:hypothetical protein
MKEEEWGKHLISKTPKNDRKWIELEILGKKSELTSVLHFNFNYLIYIFVLIKREILEHSCFDFKIILKVILINKILWLMRDDEF